MINSRKLKAIMWHGRKCVLLKRPVEVLPIRIVKLHGIKIWNAFIHSQCRIYYLSESGKIFANENVR